VTGFFFKLEKEVNNRIVPKIDLLFDQLQIALENERYETADLALAKLSKYYIHFDQDSAEYYEYAQNVVEIMLNGVDESFEPSEMDEWHDFDPDC